MYKLIMQEEWFNITHQVYLCSFIIEHFPALFCNNFE